MTVQSVSQDRDTCRSCDCNLTFYNRASADRGLCETCDLYAGRADNPRLRYKVDTDAR